MDKNKRTVYYKLDPKVTWSDGKAVTGSDYEYMLEFHRDPNIVHPWYNQYYTEEFEAVQTFKDKDGLEVVAVTLPVPKSDLLYYTNIVPKPRHFYGKLGKIM